METPVGYVSYQGNTYLFNIKNTKAHKRTLIAFPAHKAVLTPVPAVSGADVTRTHAVTVTAPQAALAAGTSGWTLCEGHG